MKKHLPFPVTVLVFKTANRNKGSIYEIGILSIDNGVELINKAIRINPKTKTFSMSEYNQDDVNAADLQSEPTFDRVYPEIAPYIEGKILLMHYAKFHEQALLTVLKRYKIETPRYRVIDIYELAPYMNLEFDEENLKFQTIARACGINRTNWTTLNKTQAIYEILCQFYEQKPAKFKIYKSKKSEFQLVEVPSQKQERTDIENTEPAKTQVLLPRSENDMKSGCLALLMIIFFIAMLTYSCGYDSDFQKNIRSENEQQKQSEKNSQSESLNAKITERPFPKGHGWADIGRQEPVYTDTIGKIDSFSKLEKKVPIYSSFYSKDEEMIGYIKVGTEVEVKAQDLKHRGYGQYAGRLLVEQYDTQQQFYINVYNYVPTRFKE